MFDYKKMQEMLAEVKIETDRSCALIIAANLENRLKDLLTDFFISMSPTALKEIFEGTNPLSTFSSRITIAFSLGLLSEQEYHDLNLIRRIRNSFAHEEHGWSFSTQIVKDRCSSFKLFSEARIKNAAITGDYSPRDRFQIVAISITLLLLERRKKAKSEQRAQHPSTSIF